MDYFKMASFSYGMNTRNYRGSGNRDMLSSYYREKGEKAYRAKAKELTGRDDFPYITKIESLNKYVSQTPEKTVVPPDSKTEKEKSPRKSARSKKKRKVRLSRHEQLGMTKDEFVEVARQCIAAAGSSNDRRKPARELIGELYNPLQYIHVGAGERDAKLPHDYQYSDGNPHDEIEPAAMFGKDFDFPPLTTESMATENG